MIDCSWNNFKKIDSHVHRFSMNVADCQLGAVIEFRSPAIVHNVANTHKRI